MDIIIFLLGASVGAGLAHHFLSSPRAMVNNLWKEIFKFSEKIAVQKKLHGNTPDSLVDILEVMIKERKEMINALLNYYFKQEDDADFIRLNRPY